MGVVLTSDRSIWWSPRCIKPKDHGLAAEMAHTFLRHIRVKSIDELKQRILLGVAEFNASPVVFRWNKFDLGLT